MHSTKNSIEILSFDGGGSRGVMALKILDDVFRLATIVLRNPETVEYLVNEESKEQKKHFLEDLDSRKRLIKNLKAVKDPIHPAHVYDMIVGTSIGGLISFGLVGGKRVGKDHHERKAMTITECIEMYLTKAKIIFKKTWIIRFFYFISKFLKIPLIPYPQANIKKMLKDQFGDCYLNDFRKNNDSSSVVGAVAKKVDPHEDIVLFDTANEDQKNYKAYEILLATSNAPVYFETPVTIGDSKYIDGGIGANCPLKQAIPRAKEIFEEDDEHKKLVSVLSIAHHLPN
ncbi:uncharacterized protein LOC124434260 [Xenia sp. Carnegie-2017]|uniref:uncharacterized protein LOC124434260 n=1 Tax=Xenia sp. Carnegie-2017 TaxID=2897299 RepID=UPI001F03665A|nr:uncharacterized protein LOC124434260 [Xenia sp. Carnegie-2017]